LAGAIVPGVARFIVTLSAQADVFGVGITAMAGSMLVPASCAVSGSIVPGGGLAGISDVDSGNAAPLVGGPPGVELQTMVDGLPSGDIGDMVPVVLPMDNVGMVPNAVPGIIAVDGIVVAVLPAMDVETVLGAVGTGVAVTPGAAAAAASGDDATGIVEPGKSVINDVAGVADSRSGAVELAVDAGEAAGTVGIAGAADVADVKGVVAIPPPTADMEIAGTAGVPGAICPVGAAQLTTVPGTVGLEASGTGASVVSGEFDRVVAENGLGPLSGDVTIVAGVVGSPMAVLPMVETCARPALQPPSKKAVVNSKPRIAITLSAPI
jgi:hypothetical protein